MFSFSNTSYTSSSASTDEAGWTRVPSRSRFSDDAAAAFGSKSRRVGGGSYHSSSSSYGFSEEAASAFGRRSTALAAPVERTTRSSGFSAAFGEEATSAFGRPASRPGRRAEFDESAASAFSGGGSARRSYHSSTAPAPAPASAKKQTYEEAFPSLGAAPVHPKQEPTAASGPTLAEKLRKKATEEADAEARRKAAADAAARRQAMEAKERAMFASISASRAYMGASHYMNEEDDVHIGYSAPDDLDYDAFGDTIEKPVRHHVPSPVSDHEYDEDAF